MGARGTRNTKRQYAGGATELLGALFEEYNNLSSYLLRDGVVPGVGCGLQAMTGSITLLETTRPIAVRINGETIIVPPTASITPPAITIADNKWAGFFLTVDLTGAITLTTTEIGALVATADTELEALLAILAESDSQLPAGEEVIGYVTLQGDATGWTGATDDFAIADALVQAINFYDVYGRDNAIITPAATFAQSATTDEMDIAATVAKMNGRRVTLAADANFPFSQNDTVNTGAAASTMWGGWLIVMDRGGVIHTLSANNAPITAGDQVYAQKADASAALDAIELLIDAQLPTLIVVARFFVRTTISDVFTANTEILNVSDAAVQELAFDRPSSEDLDYDLVANAAGSRTKPPRSLVNV